MLQGLTSEYTPLGFSADRSRRMTGIQNDTSGVEDVLLQLGSDGYVFGWISANEQSTT